MIITELHKGQGLGNQLWCYAVTRSIAKNNGVDFGIKNKENFKGIDFMNLDFGKEPKNFFNFYHEKQTFHKNGAEITAYDINLVNIPDNTEISGSMQDEQYIINHKKEVREWFQVKKEYDCYDFSNENICIINFRGGEYSRHKELFLSEKYWENAIKNMRKINNDFKFIVITDDIKSAKRFFPNFEIYHFNIGKDYSIVKNAHYLIMANSSFVWFPAWTSETLKYCIAPKYWARHNISDGYWSLGYNITSNWLYQDRKGNLFDYDQCKKELEKYNRGIKTDLAPAYFPNISSLNIVASKIKKFIPKKILYVVRKIK